MNVYIHNVYVRVDMLIVYSVMLISPLTHTN